MRRSFYRRSPPTGPTPVKETRSSNLKLIKERILNAALLVALCLGLISLLLAVPARIRENQNWVVAGFILAFSWLLLITLSRHIPFQVRSLSLIGIVLYLGVSTLILDGLEGNGRVFLLVVPVITTIFLGNRPGFYTLLLVWIFFAWVALTSPGNAFILKDFNGLGIVEGDWLLALAVFMLVSGALYGVMRALLSGLFGSLDTESELRVDLDAERSQLERRVQIRTRNIESRLQKIIDAGEILITLNSLLDPDEVLSEGVELIKEKFELYFSGIYELDEPGSQIKLRYGSGDVGYQMVRQNFSFPLMDECLPSWCVRNRKPRFASDAGQDAVIFNYPNLPETHSELVVPLGYSLSGFHANWPTKFEGERSLRGVISLQSNKVMGFTQEDIVLYEFLANGIAAAFEKVQRVQQLLGKYLEVENLNRQYLRESWFKLSRHHGMLAYTSEAAVSQDRTNTNGSPITIPLSLRDQVIGLFTIEGNLGSDQAVNLTEEDLQFVDAVLTETALALENVRLLEETQIRANNEHLLSKISRLAHSSTDLESILQLAVKEISQSMGATEAMIELEVPKVTPSNPSEQGMIHKNGDSQ